MYIDSGLLTSHSFGFDHLRLAGNCLEVRLEPGLRDQCRNYGAANYGGDKYCVLVLLVLDQKCFLTMRGSISVPAKKVNKIAPNPARKFTQSVMCRPSVLPAIAP